MYFFWKVQGALPTSVALSKIIDTFDPICGLCGRATEDVIHTFFQCQHTRATWFCSELGLKFSPIRGTSLIEELSKLLKDREADQIANFMTTAAWCIWKARYNEIFQNKTCSPQDTI